MTRSKKRWVHGGGEGGDGGGGGHTRHIREVQTPTTICIINKKDITRVKSVAKIQTRLEKKIVAG